MAADGDVARLAELNAEKDSLDPSFTHAGRLIEDEITKLKNPSPEAKNGEAKPNEYSEKDFVDVFSHKMPKVECYIKVPANEFPAVNFVGRLIGPGGSTLKGIQEVTRTRIAVLGKGSQRDKKKAEELFESGDPKWAHMKLPLHVKISAVGPVDQSYMGIGRACTEVMKLIQVDEEEAKGMNQGMGMQGGRGRGQRGRGGPQSGRGMGSRGGRGGNGSANSTPRGNGRGSGNSRGGRGSGNARGSRGNPRQSRGGGGYGQKNQQSQQSMMQTADPYSQGGQEQYGAQGYEGYGGEMCGYEGYEGYADPSAYGQEGYGAEGSYSQEQYDMSGYGYGQEAYGQDPYGNGAGDQGQYQQQQQQSQQQQSKPYRGKMMGRGGQGGSNRGQARQAGKPY